MKEVITFKCNKELRRKLEAEPKKNRRFNNMSEILRTLSTLYLENEEIKNCIHRVMKQRYSNLMDRKEL